MAKFEDTGVSLNDLDAKGYFDTINRKLAMTAQEICGQTIPGDTTAGRDFWLAEHRERITDTVAGLAVGGVVGTYYDRERFNGTISRMKEIGERFEALALGLHPLAISYDPNMGEVALRQWAAAVVGALK